MGVAPHELRAYQAAHEQGRLPVRVDAVLGIPARFLPTEEVERGLDQYFGPGPGFGNDWLRIGGLKLVLFEQGNRPTSSSCRATSRRARTTNSLTWWST
jgi:hypothetical protein